MLTEKSDSTSDKSRSAFEQSKMANSEYMRRPIRAKTITVLAIAVLVLAGTAAAKYAGGNGEPNDPYRIATATDLNDIGNYEEDWDKHFVLVNDVNLTGYTSERFKIIGRWIDWYDPNNKPFTGVFDGNEHKIWNFTWDSNGINSVGLFGYVGSDGQIKNLGLENIDVNAVNGNFIGGLVGEMDGGTITGCYTTGRVLGNRDSVAGLVGDIEAGTITNCYSTASISETGWNVGGLVGFLGGTIANSYAAGHVTGTGNAGGLLGHNEGIIYKCWGNANVTGGGSVGGLVGYNCEGGMIIDCYSTGSVDGNNCIGGLVGVANEDSWITNCYSTGSVSGISYVGGLVGGNQWGTTMASFWDKQTSSRSWSASGEPKTTAEMKTKSTFTDAGWDFVEIWGIGENQTYPFLQTDLAGDLDHDKKVNLIDLAIMAAHWLAQNNP